MGRGRSSPGEAPVPSILRCGKADNRQWPDQALNQVTRPAADAEVGVGIHRRGSGRDGWVDVSPIDAHVIDSMQPWLLGTWGRPAPMKIPGRWVRPGW